MTTRVKIALWAGGALMAVSLVGNGLGCNKIREERTLRTTAEASLKVEHASLTKTAKALATAKAEALSSEDFEKFPLVLPDGRPALDGHGNPIFTIKRHTLNRSSSSSSSSSSSVSASSSASVSSTARSSHDETELSEKPAVKKWLAMVWAEPTTGTIWAAAGFRQSLWIIEVSVWAGNPVPIAQTPEFRPALGLSVAF